MIKALRARFDGASPAQAGDEAFQANARYLNGICIFRKGHYVGGYANLAKLRMLRSWPHSLPLAFHKWSSPGCPTLVTFFVARVGDQSLHLFSVRLWTHPTRDNTAEG